MMPLSDAFKVEIPDVFSKYKTIKVLERGGFSIVVQAEDTKTNELVACKLVSRDGLVRNNMLLRFEQELRINQSIDHPNISKIRDVIYTKDLFIIVMNYYENGDIVKYTHQQGTLTLKDTIEIIKKLITAVSYLHKRNIAHRDIKLENIALDNDLNPVLIDFGAAASAEMMHGTFIGTNSYYPPEVYYGEEYDAKAFDIWSLGVTCFVLVTGSFPWKNEDERELMEELKSGKYVIPNVNIPDVNRLVKRSIVVDPKKRAKIEELEVIMHISENKPYRKQILPTLITKRRVSMTPTMLRTSKNAEESVLEFLRKKEKTVPKGFPLPMKAPNPKNGKPGGKGHMRVRGKSVML